MSAGSSRPISSTTPTSGSACTARIYSYSSGDEQWSVVTGIKERVEREFDAEYQIGRLREDRWSINYSLIYDRDGTTRFYGIGNETHERDQTNYTDQQEFGQVQIGLNFNHTWQLLYTVRLQSVDVLPGTLNDVPSINTRFPQALGTNKEFLNRLSLVYDTRDDLTVPTRGMKWVLYVGASAKDGLVNDSSYSEAGIDGRGIWPVAPDTVLAAHMSLRYLPTVNDIPFWALSNIGGGESVIGGEQPLRGFGAGRFYDRDSFSTTVELRRKVFSFDAVTTLLDIEVAPFVGFRPRVLAARARTRSSMYTRCSGSGFGASRAPTSSAMSISAMAAKAPPYSQDLIIPFNARPAAGTAALSSALCGSSSTISYQIAFSTAKDKASPVPRIQLKYHISNPPSWSCMFSSVIRPRSTLNTQPVYARMMGRKTTTATSMSNSVLALLEASHTVRL